jgi:hypothetical protein
MNYALQRVMNREQIRASCRGLPANGRGLDRAALAARGRRLRASRVGASGADGDAIPDYFE